PPLPDALPIAHPRPLRLPPSPARLPPPTHPPRSRVRVRRRRRVHPLQRLASHRRQAPSPSRPRRSILHPYNPSLPVSLLQHQLNRTLSRATLRVTLRRVTLRRVIRPQAIRPRMWNRHPPKRPGRPSPSRTTCVTESACKPMPSSAQTKGPSTITCSGPATIFTLPVR